MEEITPIGITDWRNQHQKFGIKDKDRFSHIYVVGKTGTGKSTLLKNMAISDIRRGLGVCVIDPHGDVVSDLLQLVPVERAKDVIYLDPADPGCEINFNPFDNNQNNPPHLIISGLISTFSKLWEASWGPRLEYILRYALMALLEYPDATLLHIQPLLVDTNFRKHVLNYCTDDQVRQFWLYEFEKYSPSLKAEAISPILNKAGVFAAIRPLRKTIGYPKSSFQIQEVMDTGKILLCNVSKGRLGEDASRIIGSFIVNAIQLGGLRRAAQSEQDRRPFYLYVDEFHCFVSNSFLGILSEARKYKLSIFIAHQYLNQIDEQLRYSILGNVGTIIAFRTGTEDAEYFAKEFYPVFKKEDFINLPKFSMYIKLMIDGATSKPFSAQTHCC